MSASPFSPGADMGNHWELSSGASSPRSDTSSNTNSLFSSPDSPANTELSFSSLGPNDVKQSSIEQQPEVMVLPSFANHVLVGGTVYSPGQIRGMSEGISKARMTGEFPNTSSATEDPQIVIEDYQYLKRLRDARGDPALPPSEQYNILKVDIARRIQARDEMQGAPANFQEVDHRVQNWMSSINKEARMLEITQAALQRKGINNPTQDDLDAIAEEFMQIAERTLLDVANPLRMNATRMEGNMSRFDSQLDGFDGAMTAQIGTLNDVMTSQLNTLNTLNTILGVQTNTFNGSVGMLNTALTTVTTDLHQLTASLPSLIATTVQAAVKEQLSLLPHQQFSSTQHQSNYDQPPRYATITQMQQHQTTDGELYDGSLRVVTSAVQVPGQESERTSHLSTQFTKSRFRRFLRVITGRAQSKKGAGSK